MDAHVECGPCVLRQALDTVRETDADVATERRAVRRTATAIGEMSFDRTPMTIAARAQAIVREETGIDDPFGDRKRLATETVADMRPALVDRLDGAADRFERAVRLAIAGNVIDVGPGHEVDIEATIDDVLDRSFAIDRLDALRADLADADDVLYLLDNAGEVVLDRLLIESIDADVTAVAKADPFLNDVTAADAFAAGIDEVATVETRGTDGVGTITDGFADRLRAADVVISKGQGNYELFSDCDASIYFLLLVKCGVVADDIGAPEGSVVVA
ncbi:damage-control phosphatase ARMT1 family protein [Halococcoides cellulosivorans]|uniref:Damage-control phosphatase ARMT1-like metal-binding domain-containing protein n=1 Tax=Halococcoides cellulosivorans TaxID=1679096 RepID=A0A2R4WXL0_9EURY|nr:ARMT1-like domain-containing protein [Halococcoides cellulosivorans]AWB26289.1 hypothetical protein HARCEL1_00425 [Halococcoides cellulosivorans]